MKCERPLLAHRLLVRPITMYFDRAGANRARCSWLSLLFGAWAFLVALLIVFPANTNAQSYLAAACDHPNVPSRLVSGPLPAMPPLAQQQGITGEVRVRVSLSEESKLREAKIDKSPSAMLNNAALQAARLSSFSTAIEGCSAVASDLIIAYEFAMDGNVTIMSSSEPEPVRTSQLDAAPAVLPTTDASPSASNVRSEQCRQAIINNLQQADRKLDKELSGRDFAESQFDDMGGQVRWIKCLSDHGLSNKEAAALLLATIRRLPPNAEGHAGIENSWVLAYLRLAEFELKTGDVKASSRAC